VFYRSTKKEEKKGFFQEKLGGKVPLKGKRGGE
jgi:hypothetical protein